MENQTISDFLRDKGVNDEDMLKAVNFFLDRLNNTLLTQADKLMKQAKAAESKMDKDFLMAKAFPLIYLGYLGAHSIDYREVDRGLN